MNTLNLDVRLSKDRLVLRPFEMRDLGSSKAITFKNESWAALQ